ncbi:histidine phosphatase family protein [Mycobacterium conspicuum]|jgi:broad specificity phosphatase PhoE|uniref:Phosphoglycerate mutase n=1 Tax=Mycobacterium conspicuum TaxID=44010 RepID=A0A1X1SYH4_9MYCO|nr:histidine phosphatase family protein [Mycobacterium conspicuum]ORV36635.1 histidine phosphatase [Mycobacterium conspicuum]BBZ41881.1 phosphoglycerate mutase [Mycobacterium conspicuum]
MTELVRLTLVSHAMTDAMAAARFSADEPLNDSGCRQAAVGFEIKSGTRQLTAPERRARQTAQLLGLRPVIEPRLADLNCGRWRGRALDDVPPADLDVWLTDPRQAPHGGESIADLVDRVAAWLASLSDNASRTVAVTHPAVIRAAILTALGASPNAFWRMDIKPLSRTVLHRRGSGWTLRI